MNFIFISFLQNTKPTLYLDKTLTINKDDAGIKETISEVRRLNEQDVDLYAWICNEGRYTGVAPVGSACDNIRYRKSSLTRGPSRGVIETAEVV